MWHAYPSGGLMVGVCCIDLCRNCASRLCTYPKPVTYWSHKWSSISLHHVHGSPYLLIAHRKVWFKIILEHYLFIRLCKSMKVAIVGILVLLFWCLLLCSAGGISDKDINNWSSTTNQFYISNNGQHCCAFDWMEGASIHLVPWW